MIKRFFMFTLTVIYMLFSFSGLAISSGITVSAQCAVVMNADTFEVVYEKNAQQIRSMASTTKIMTSILAVESGKLDETVSVKKDITVEGTSIGAKKGYEYKLIDLVYGMLLESGNDAAVMVAEYLCRSEENFAVQMNTKAREIGMNNTNFVTASGLDDENHYTTAYDMALLGSYAVKNETFKEICSAKTKQIHLMTPDLSFTFTNHNRLLNSCEGVFGIKTGFTKKSGRCLVSACERSGVKYVVVTLNAPDDWQDHKKLYDYAYSVTKKHNRNPDLPRKLTVYGGTISGIELCSESIEFGYVNKSNYDLQVILPKFIYAPVKKGDTIGAVRVIDSGRIVLQQSIYASQDVQSVIGAEKVRKNLIERFIDYFK